MAHESPTVHTTPDPSLPNRLRRLLARLRHALGSDDWLLLHRREDTLIWSNGDTEVVLSRAPTENYPRNWLVSAYIGDQNDHLSLIPGEDADSPEHKTPVSPFSAAMLADIYMNTGMLVPAPDEKPVRSRLLEYERGYEHKIISDSTVSYICRASLI